MSTVNEKIFNDHYCIIFGSNTEVHIVFLNQFVPL